MTINESQNLESQRARRLRLLTFTAEEMAAMVPASEIDRLRDSIKTMGPYEADPSTLSPEDEARLDRWVEGYCASGHDPNYAGPDSD